MILRKTISKDINKVLDMYKQGRLSLKKDGVDQWQNEGPSYTSLISDIKEGYSYVLEDDNKIVGTLAIVDKPEPTYFDIEGSWLNELPYLTVHRFTVSHLHRNKGYGFNMFKETEKLCIEKGFNNIRVDTHKDNIKMNSLLIKLGYSYCGIIKLENGDLRNAYQKEV
ncbi:MAG: GNAT family N-acetyltransferase [Lagierella massiliensis]|nr:GNAT family N-acetyltransferase [Lagierella massiliensis]